MAATSHPRTAVAYHARPKPLALDRRHVQGGLRVSRPVPALGPRPCAGAARRPAARARVLSCSGRRHAARSGPLLPRGIQFQTIVSVQIPETHYAHTVDGLSVAYQTVGDGPPDVVLLRA